MEDENTQFFKKAQRPTVKQASVLFSVAVLLFVTIGTRAQRYNLLGGLLITEFVLLMGSALIFLKSGRFNIKEVLRLNRVGIMPFVLTFFIMLFMIPVISIINLGNLSIIKTLFGRVLLNQPPVATDTSSLLVNIAVIGASAGICEEILFRGVIQRAYEGLGWKKGILIAAFLFGLMHMDFQKLLGTFILGVLIGYLVHKTNSLFVGMFAHFCNNSLAVAISYSALKYTGKASEAASKGSDIDLSSITSLPGVQLAAVIIVWLFIFGICASVVISLLAVFNKYAGKYHVDTVDQKPVKNDYSGLLYTLPAVALIFIFYFYQAYKLSFQNIPFLEEVLKLIMGS